VGIFVIEALEIIGHFRDGIHVDILQVSRAFEKSIKALKPLARSGPYQSLASQKELGEGGVFY